MSKRPSHHANAAGTLFRNPWPSATPPTWTELAWGGIPVGWKLPHLSGHPKARDIRVVKPDWGAKMALGTKKDLKGTWLGHASVFVELPWSGSGDRTAKLLFDPMFSYKAGPTAYTGPGRLRGSPCKVEDLPGVDCVLISHNHYDHLDLSSILAVKAAYPDALYFVPLGNKQWFLDTGIKEEKIHELDWWDDVDVYCDDLGLVSTNCGSGASPESRMRMTCVPSQHNSGRGARDQLMTLWAGWVVEHFVDSPEKAGEDPTTRRVTRRGAIYHAGDTGYRRYARSDSVCPAFEEIGQKFGPFDLSFLPIWRGGTLGFISWAGLRLDHDKFPSMTHGTPGDAVCIHKDVKSRNSIGIHFGTFIGAEDESLEAVIELQEALEDAGVRDLDSGLEGPHGRMGVLDIGESWVVQIEDLAIF